MSKRKSNGSTPENLGPGYIQPPPIKDYLEEEAGPGEKITERLKSTSGKIIKRERNRATLIMLSGGVDSVYALVKLLKESDDIVLAHHIHLINHDGRHLAEAKACEQIVRYCKANIRNFTFTESTIDRQKFKAFGLDIVTAAFEAGIVVQNFYSDTGSLVDRWTCGINAEDFDGWDADDTDRHRRPSMLKAIEANCHPLKPPRFFNLPLKPKHKLVEYLGEELQEMCWTCRRPIQKNEHVFTECGECITCKAMMKIRK